MSYICNDCGAVFQEPNKAIYGGNPWGQDFCPECGGTDFEECFYCEECGAPVPDSAFAFHMCHECETATKERLQKHLNTYSKNQLAFLTWAWEGEEFERSTE